MPMKPIVLTVGVCSIALLLICDACSSLSLSRRYDEQKIRVMVLEDHISSRLVGNADAPSLYKFYFLDITSGHEKRSLGQFFHDSKPPVICGTDRLMHGDYGIALDRVTGARVIVFSVKIESFSFSEARVTSTSYTSNTGAESFNYTLIHTNKQWKIIRKEIRPMS